MRLEISPVRLAGDVVIPPSKSLSHRAIIAAAMAEGRSSVTNLKFSEDIKATTEAMESLGARFQVGEDYEVIDGVDKLKRLKDEIQCRESGSTIRFMIPVALLAQGKVTFKGEGRLCKRPLGTFLDIFDEQGISYSKGEDELPLTVDGMLKPGRFRVPGDISSQFITGLLYALPKLEGDSVIEISSKLESKGYIDLTLDVLASFGIEIENRDYREFHIRGKQKYRARDYRVEGDYSQVAFWMVAGALGSNIRCHGMRLESLQGDKAIHGILKDMKAEMTEGEVITVKPSETQGTVIDLSQCPDLGPIITVLASLSRGKTEIVNAKRLRIKESDRITSMTTELNKLGARITETEEGMIIEGVETLQGGVTVSAWNDHRVAMALAMAATRCEKPIILEGAESVKKSYPHFWTEYERVGGKIKEV
ncbi:3-phosphoshikimate 1-carboxyvinyltransferase [Propionigenium maris DSM 9537]|uniref:3-phosphoshikimate 1-carboxyvinyltransferase n=1 Tax=Propionigenium maris DSM 9537 TaxID=1123000 RepID=A0A9W6GJC6_9FUSO|nr:3-phosphoshikimate 1-carboxyvinyltransferase [Propionigenium maris]GLI55225.1 3-phosphoshikimate 1-carboxyvinyltransferase [Propionigenium maris DSM 9537]